MGKDKQRRCAARKAKARGDAKDTGQQDQVQAGSNPATTSNAHLGTSHRQAASYLTHEQLDVMDPSTKVVLDVTHMLGKECKIYTVADILLETIEDRADNLAGGGRREMKQLYTSALEKAKKLDPKKLFEKMNTGTDTDILNWKLFSIECLHISVLQHVVSNTKLRVWVDNVDLTPAKRATRERARIYNITIAITADTQLRIYGLASRFETLPGPVALSSSVDELGDDDIVELDMEKILGHPCVLSVPSAVVKTRSDHFRSRYHEAVERDKCRSRIDTSSEFSWSAMTCSELRRTHYQNLSLLRSVISKQGHISTNVSECVDLVVLARYLYDKPIPVRIADSGTHPEATFMDDGNVESLVTQATPEMLHTITIPDAIAGEGGYIVAGMFRPDHGIETVHLKLSDFKPYDDIMLHLWQDTDSCMPIARLSNRRYMNELEEMKAAIVGDTDKAFEVNKMQESCELPNHSFFIDQVRTDDPAAINCLKQALLTRMAITVFNQALYGTPARLYYTSDRLSGDNDARTVRYLEHVRIRCCKKLEESNVAGDCCTARLESDSPMPEQQQQPDKPSCPEPNTMRSSRNFEAHVTEFTSEMLHPCIVPSSAAGKGGYVVTGKFRSGRGFETVHLEVSDFKPDDDIMLHLMDEDDSCMLASRLSNKNYIMGLAGIAMAVGNDKSAADRVIENTQKTCKLPGNPSFIELYLAHDPEAIDELHGIIRGRTYMTMLRQALYGTPTRLFYSSAQNSHEHDPQLVAYLAHVRGLCCKKLEESDGVTAITIWTTFLVPFIIIIVIAIACEWMLQR